MTQPHPRKSAGMDVLRYLLIIMAILLIIGGAAGGLIAVGSSGNSWQQALINGVLLLAAGATLGVFLLGLAGGLAMLEERVQQGRLQQRSMENLQAAIYSLQQSLQKAPPLSVPMPAVKLPGESRGEVTAKDIAELLQQSRDLALMDERQRGEAARRHWASRRETLMKALDRGIGMNEWHTVYARLTELKTIAPDDPEILALDERITREQALRLEGDLAAAQNQIRHSMSISAWDQADEVLTGLRRKYPGAPQVDEIAGRLQRERAAFERENADRLFLDLADATDHRNWGHALLVGEEIVHKYPGDLRVEKLERDLGTLRENAGAQERKEWEEHFKDLLKRQRYEEAVAVARNLMNKYPGSPAAIELMKLVPKVEDLMRAEQTRRQQVNAGGQA